MMTPKLPTTRTFPALLNGIPRGLRAMYIQTTSLTPSRLERSER